MRNWIKYFGGNVKMVLDDGTVMTQDFFVANNETEFTDIANAWAAFERNTFPTSRLLMEAGVMYCQLKKATLLWLINGMTLDGGKQWNSFSIAPAFYGQFDRDHTGISTIKKVFLTTHPRKPRKKQA